MSRWRVVWAVLLSLLPGLGHVYARAWGAGVALLIVNLVCSLAFAVWTRFAAPAPDAMTVLAAVLVAGLAIEVAIMVDAARRVRTAPQRPVPRWYRSTWFTLAVAVAAQVLLVPEGGWRSFSIPSGSMVPALMVGDYLVVSTVVPFSGVRRGDVVVFQLPRDPSIDYVKRVIGLPGDTVAMQAGQVVLNGVALPLRPDGEMVVEDRGVRLTTARLVETLPDGRTYPVLKTSATGAANTMAAVTVPAESLFVMGDNRDNSLDSRFADGVGFVPGANLVGRAGTFYWSADRSRILQPVR